jgi:hypothetical protein
LEIGKYYHKILQFLKSPWDHETSLAPPLSIKVPVSSKESEWSYNIYMYARGIDFVSISTIICIEFGIVPTMFLFYLFYYFVLVWFFGFFLLVCLIFLFVFVFHFVYIFQTNIYWGVHLPAISNCYC